MEYDELSQIAFRYGTDKCPQWMHPYTPYYYSLFKDRKHTVKKVIEVGIGYWYGMEKEDETHYDKNLKRTYQKGASLKMWRDFFPNAMIYGVDYKRAVMFEDERIKTFLLDSRKPKHLYRLIKETGTDIDLFVDDGSHWPEDQLKTCHTVMPLLKNDTIYVIEDVKQTEVERVMESLKRYKVERPVLQKRTVKPNKPDSILLTVRNR